MDELSRTSRLSRRFALAAIVCCSAASGFADQPTGVSTSGTFRSLLSRGWSGPAVKSPARNSESAPTISHDLSNRATKPTPRPVPSATAAGDSKTEVSALPTGPAPSPAIAELVRPELKVLQVPDSVVIASDPGGSNETRPDLSPPAPESLAELIQQRTKKIVVPRLEGDADEINVDLAPSVNRLDVDRPIAAEMAKIGESQSNVRVADPIQTDPQHPAPQQAAEPQAGPETSVVSRDPQPHPETPAGPPSEKLAEAAGDETKQTESSVLAAEPTEALPDAGRVADVAGPVETAAPAETSAPAESGVEAAHPGIASEPTGSVAVTVEGQGETVSSEMSERSRRIANDGGFSLLPLKSFEPESAKRIGAEDGEPSLTSTIHANRLREIAREALRNAHHRLQCRATFSAKRYALEALRSIVAMRDAQSGGNQHAKFLKTGFDAIRESEDFAGRLGTVDASAMKRMVAVHETDALKDQDLDNMTALRATESYLAVARSNFVQAAAGVREGSDALVLLGKIERYMAGRDNTHAAAVAVTLQRAAVEVQPQNALAYRELGVTLLHQGLVEQAVEALNRSIEIQPTRTGYERLLEASRRLGDIDTARMCLASLKNPQLPSELPIRRLTPEAFATTHRPELASYQSAPVKSKTDQTVKPKPEQPRVGLRSLFPFRRR